MKRSVVVSGVAAGFLLVSPALAFATTPTGGTPVPVSTPGSPVTGYTSTPAPKPPQASVSASPKTAHPGDKVTAIGRCYRTHDPRTMILPEGPGTDGQKSVRELSRVVTPIGAGAIVKAEFRLAGDAKQGDYHFTLLCDGMEPSAIVHVVPAKTPVKKQVEKVPAGAPQTGGTDGPIDGGSDGVAMAAGAMGVLAVGGAGLVALRRRRAE